MKIKYHIYGALLGIVVGFISVHTLFIGSAWAIVFWGIVGLVLGWFTEKENVRIIGVHYGFMLVLSFLLFGFHGKSEVFLKFLLASIGASIIGGLCGWLNIYVGNWLKNKLWRKNII